jgi:hypothetical protein
MSESSADGESGASPAQLPARWERRRARPPGTWAKLTWKDKFRIEGIEAAIAGGMSESDAVWSVIGKGGSCALVSFDRDRAKTAAEREKCEEPRPPDWRLSAWYRALVRRVEPERLQLAREAASRRLVAGSEAAARTMSDLAAGDFSVGRVQVAVKTRDGVEMVEAVDSKAAMVALLASEKVLQGIGVSTRGSTNGGGGVAVQVNAGDGAVQVNVFDALKRVTAAQPLETLDGDEFVERLGEARTPENEGRRRRRGVTR